MAEEEGKALKVIAGAINSWNGFVPWHIHLDMAAARLDIPTVVVTGSPICQRGVYTIPTFFTPSTPA